MRRNLICGAFYSPPLVYRGHDGSLFGALPDVVSEMATRAGYGMELRDLDHSQLSRFSAYEFDLALSVYAAPTRRDLGEVVGLVAEVAVQVAVLTSIAESQGWSTLDDVLATGEGCVVKEGDIGHDVMRGLAGDRWVRIAVEPSDSGRGLADLLGDPRCQVVVSDALTLTNIMGSLPRSAPDRRLALSRPEVWVGLGVLVSRGSPYTSQAFRADWDARGNGDGRRRLSDLLAIYSPAAVRLV